MPIAGLFSPDGNPGLHACALYDRAIGPLKVLLRFTNSMKSESGFEFEFLRRELS